MNLIHKIESWGDSHHPKFLDVIRIILGVFLLLKGLGFMDNTAYLRSVIENRSDISVSPDILMALVYYVTFVHLVGGTLIALGVLTRFSSIMQIPVVFGAVFFINMFQSPFNTDMASSITALIFLIVFAVIGSGKLSLENYLHNQEDV
ncbi:DoxX family protein [Mucilaginibacter sp. McL0603]|uniref:DoxX family protein n=1 Tax=Mucilaginibacter sp. McL0603 TaxID=3415670 RepID=UPI003CEC3410